jgi:hypothetical protein
MPSLFENPLHLGVGAKRRHCSSRQDWAPNTGHGSGCKGTKIWPSDESYIGNEFYRIREMRPEGI